jgi:hypothetical protein
MSEDRITQLLDKQAIYDVVMTYARAIDRLDETMLRSVFHPDSTHNHFYQGPSSAPEREASGDDPGDFVRFAFNVLSAYRYTHHQLGNTLVEFDSDTSARVETYFTAFHRMRAQGDPLAPDNAQETEMDYFVAGRYLDRFELRGDAWKIAHRTGMTDWIRLEAPSSPGTAGIDQETIGKRAPDDFLYKLASVQAHPD